LECAAISFELPHQLQDSIWVGISREAMCIGSTSQENEDFLASSMFFDELLNEDSEV